jgi:nitroimidazol reductase NimA-like FMN-containing flavoprotein (pyridoxamine 5'-phosphate oxidase superfamily)
MSQPQVSRPLFPKGYVDRPKTFVPWSHVEQRLTNAHNYWLCTVRPNGRPHSIPKWAVWVNGSIYFDGSSETRHARNIATNPFVSLHLESGDDVVIVEGTARPISKPSTPVATQVAHAYTAKYAAEGYSPKPTQWNNGGLFEITPRTVLAWTSFVDDPTKFELTPD